MKYKHVSSHGFTLIELLVVIGIIAILAAIVAIAINPGRQYGQARDAQRWSDVNALINAISQYAADTKGDYPPGLPSDVDSGGQPTTLMGSASGSYNLCTYIVTKYMPAMPFDPAVTGANYTSCASYATGYTIALVGGRVIIAAPNAEQTATISITR